MLATGVPSAARRTVTLLTLLAFMTAGCGGSLADVSLGKPAPEVATPARYAAALRLAALGRVEARGGADEVAAEHFRAAYRKYPDASFLLAYSSSAERAKLYAEAHDALRRALTQALSPDERTRIEAEVARLEPLVPPGLVRVAIQVSPEGARVELTRQQAGNAAVDPRKAGASSRPVDRIALGTGWLFLQPGSWAIYSVAKGYQSDLRSLQVAPEGAELLEVALSEEDTGPQFADNSRPKVAHPDTQKLEPKEVEKGPVVEFQDRPKVRRSRIHTLGPVVLSALGVLAVGAGGYFGWQVGQNADLANGLTGQGLSKANYTAQFDFYHQATLDNSNYANYAFVSGGALVALGTVWWLLAPSQKSTAMAEGGPATDRPARAALQLPSLGLSPSGVTLNWPL